VQHLYQGDMRSVNCVADLFDGQTRQGCRDWGDDADPFVRKGSEDEEPEDEEAEDEEWVREASQRSLWSV